LLKALKGMMLKEKPKRCKRMCRRDVYTGLYYRSEPHFVTGINGRQW